MRQALSFLAGTCTAAAALPLAVAVAGTDRPPTAFASRIVPASDANDAGSGSMRDANGLFHVDGLIGGKPMRLLVDTGASHMVLSHADARKLGPQTSLTDKSELLTAGGTVKVDWILIDELLIDGHPVRKLKAAVPHRDIGVSLLGQNALAHFEAVHIDGDRLTFAR